MSRTILLVLGILAVLGGLMLAVLWFRQSSVPSAPVVRPVSTQSILVAGHPIAEATLLRLTDMTWREVPLREVVATDVAKGGAAETDFVGAVTRRAFASGQALTTDALVKPGDPDFLVAALGPGYRAVSISVDATQSTSGLNRAHA